MTHSGTTGLDSRVAAILSYSLWWTTGVLFLILERQQPVVRFHAAQSVVLFGGLSLVLVAVGGVGALALVLSSPVYQVVKLAGDLVWAGAAVLWLVLVLRAWRGETWRVPLVAALADRLVEKTSW